MALTRAIAASGEVVTNTELTVTANIAGKNVVYLPAIGNGSGGTAAAQATIGFVNAHASATLEILDANGARVFYLLPQSEVMLKAHGDATYGFWEPQSVPSSLTVKAAQVGTNGSVTPTLGANGPAGMTAASTGWLKIVDANGVAKYIPTWTA